MWQPGWEGTLGEDGYTCVCVCMQGWVSLLSTWGYRNTVNLLCVCSVTQSCPTLCNPMDCSPPGSSVRGIFQARILEWVAVSFSGGSSWPRDRTCVSCVSYIGRQILYHWAKLMPSAMLQYKISFFFFLKSKDFKIEVFATGTHTPKKKNGTHEFIFKNRNKVTDVEK